MKFYFLAVNNRKNMKNKLISTPILLKPMKTLLTIISGLLSVILLFADNATYPVTNIPDSLLENANTVIRDRTEHFDLENIGKAKEHIRAVITILDSKSGYDELYVYYDQFAKVGKIKGHIYDANGEKVRDIEKSEVKDYAAYDGFSVFSDLRFKHVDFTYGRYPYTIEYEYDVSYDGLQTYSLWRPQQYKTSVQNSSYTITTPTGIAFRHRATNLNDEPNRVLNSSTVGHTWQLTNRRVVSREPYAPDTFQPLPELQVLPNEFKVDGHVGNMETWQSFGQFMYELNQNRDRLSGAMRDKVQQLTANATTDKEKIEILYRYLQENMRYVSVQLGIGGWQTFDADYVENNKYGDCKALTNYMKAMLKAVGIPAYASLINLGEQRFEITEDYVNPLAFNHVILHIPSEDMWLECTSTNSPANYLGSSTQDRFSLLITEKGGKLLKTPAITDNLQSGNTTVTIGEDGSAVVKSETQFTGVLHEYFRYIADQYSPDERTKWFKKGQHFPSFEIKKLEISTAKSKPTASLNYEIKSQRYATKAGKRLFVPLNLVNQMNRSLPKDDERQQPVAFPLGYTDSDTITFKLPSSYKLESLPSGTEMLDSPYGTYRVTVEEKDDTIIYKRQLTIHPVDVPASEYEALRAFYQQIANMDSAKMVLVRRSA